MPIAIDYTPAFRQRAGIGRFVRDLTRTLIARDKDTEYRLVTFGRPPAEDLPSNAKFLPIPITERLALILWHRLHVPLPLDPFLRGADLYHGTNFLLPPLRRTPGVVTIHDLSYLTFPQFAEPSLAAFLTREAPRSVRAAAAICADSQATRDDLIRLLGVPAGKVTVVYGGVHPGFRPASGEDIRRAAAKYPLDRPYLFALGTREPRKNLAGLLDAFEILRNRQHMPRLLIAGPEGWRQEGFATKLAHSPYRNDVISLGFVPEEDLPALLTASACFVFPSYYEGFGLPVLEALACAAPVVCGNASSLPEIGGDAVITAPASDAAAIADSIERVLLDGDLSRSLRERGPARAAEFRWEAAADVQREVYRRVLARR